MVPPGDVGTWAQLGGVVAVLGFFITSFLRGWIVPGPTYRDLQRDRDDWKQIALMSTNAAEKTLSQSEHRRADREAAARDAARTQ